MEIGRIYKIWYIDSQNILRARTVKILKETEHMIEYENQYNKNIEGIAISLLHRFEKVGRYENIKGN
jgi:hypothetical protein